MNECSGEIREESAATPDKKCGAESSDPNRHSQPRLPGSVVGEASMRCLGISNKITKVSELKLLRVKGRFQGVSE